MNYGLIKNITGSNWMLEPKTMGALYPLLMGIFSGLEFSEEIAEKKAPIQARNFNQNFSENDFINVHQISGVILKYDMQCGQLGLLSVCEDMLLADKNSNCIGHLIMIDSGGGSADAVPEWENMMKQLTKPVIGYINGMAASAAMYILSYCDYIFAHHNSDEIGCIGTYCSFASFPKRTELEDGRIYMRIYADEASDKNAAFEAALEGNVELIKETNLNPHNARFIEDMKRNRPGCTDDQLHGKLFFASDVVGSFIDEIGTVEQACQKIIELSDRTETAVADIKNDNKQPNYMNMQKSPTPAAMLDTALRLDESGNISISESLNEKMEEDLNLKSSEIATLSSEIQSLKKEIENQKESLLQKDVEIAQLKDAVTAATPKDAAEPAAVNPISSDANTSNNMVDGLKDWYKTRKN